MTKVSFFVLIILFFALASQSDSANILAVLTFPSISHQVVFRPLTQELAKRGHKVTVITTDPAFPRDEAPLNLTEINVHEESYAAWRNAVNAIKGKADPISQINYFSSVVNGISESQFRSYEIQKLLNEEKEFDLIIAEACMRPALIFSYIYKAPVIQISSLGSVLFNKNAMGIPIHPILYPRVSSTKIYNLTKLDKLLEILKHLLLQWVFEKHYVEAEDAMLKKVFGTELPDVPSVSELNKNVDMSFVNVHSMWEENVPVPPNVIHIWGIYKRVETQLTEDILSYLETSKHGVIYMSFGTNAPSSLPADKIQAFVKVFSELPYNIVWKWDSDQLPGRSENIRIGKWFPQAKLLKHPKIKLFITQGGLQSTEEAIESGVPVIGVPLIADQYYNVEKYEHFKIGKKLNFETLTEIDIRNAIETVINDYSYRENIIKLRTLMRDEPEPALDRAVWWTEYVLRHKGAKHLRAAGANLSWAEYYELELISTVVISLLIISLGFFYATKYGVTFIRAKSGTKKNQ